MWIQGPCRENNEQQDEEEQTCRHHIGSTCSPLLKLLYGVSGPLSFELIYLFLYRRRRRRRDGLRSKRWVQRSPRKHRSSPKHKAANETSASRRKNSMLHTRRAIRGMAHIKSLSRNLTGVQPYLTFWRVPRPRPSPPKPRRNV